MSYKVNFCVFLIFMFSPTFVLCQTPSTVCDANNQGRHFPTGLDCPMYHTCYNGQWFTQRCPDPFWFDFLEENCNLPQNARCILGPANMECSASNQGRHFPTNYNCSSYFTCFNGMFHLQNCPFPFFFDAEREVCDLPENVFCLTGPGDVECDDSIEGQHFQTVFNCSSYWTCHNLRWYLQECPNPFWFDADRQVCDLPENVDCPLITTTTALPEVECPPTGIVFLPNPLSCVDHYLCLAGFRIERSCSPPLEFSREQGRCVRPAISDCQLLRQPLPKECPPDNDPDNVVFLPRLDNCQRFFICYSGHPKEFDCGPTLHFDPVDQWCIKEEDSKCVPQFQMPDKQEIDCPEETMTELQFLPHPESCQFYFICFRNVSSVHQCHHTLQFDHIIGDCYFRDQAVCYPEIKS